MSGRERRLTWLPPFLLGAVGASAGELAAGLLLYTAEGLLRSLTIVLATEMLALGLGLLSSRHLEPGDLSAVRRRWVLALLACVGGTAFSAAWEMSAGFSATRISQALGLVLLAGVPLFAVGSALGALAITEERSRTVGTAAALGAAGGVVVTGLVAVPAVPSVSLFLSSVVAVSAAALLHGWLLDRRVLVRVLAEEPGDGDEPVLRLEERIRAGRGSRGRILTVDGRPAAGAGPGDEAVLPWERTAADLLEAERGGAERVLVVGMAGAGLTRVLDGASGIREVVAVEPWRRIRELRERADAWQPDPATVIGWSAVGEAAPFGALVLNLRLLPGGGPIVGPGIEVLEEVAASRASATLILGGVSLAPGPGSGIVEWISGRPWSPRRLVLLRPGDPAEEGAGALLRETEGAGGGLVVGRSGAGSGERVEPEGAEVLLDRRLEEEADAGPMERARGT